MGRPRKVVVPSKADIQAASNVFTLHEYRCVCCGKVYETPMKNFYKATYSKRWKGFDGYCPICRPCIDKMLDEYSRRYKSDETAAIIMSSVLDIPFYYTMFESVTQKNNNFTMGMFTRLLNNNKQYMNKDFSITIASGELSKSREQIQDDRERRWSTQECRNKNECIKFLGSDVFQGYADDDRRYLYSELIKYLDDDLVDDAYKLSQVTQICCNNNQIRIMDLTISGMDPIADSSEIRTLNEIKNKLVSSNDKIAKENEISVKNRSNKGVGKGTLGYLMRDLRGKDFHDAEVNFYDQLRSEGTQWAADMSLKAIKENAFFDENDQKDIFEKQRSMIDAAKKENDDLKENNRLLLIKIREMEEERHKRGRPKTVVETELEELTKDKGVESGGGSS